MIRLSALFTAGVIAATAIVLAWSAVAGPNPIMVPAPSGPGIDTTALHPTDVFTMTAGGSIGRNDDVYDYWGTGVDVAVHYNGTDWYCDPANVGSGRMCIGSESQAVCLDPSVDGVLTADNEDSSAASIHVGSVAGSGSVLGVGGTCATAHSLDSDDACFPDDMEVHGYSYFDTGFQVNGNVSLGANAAALTKANSWAIYYSYQKQLALAVGSFVYNNLVFSTLDNYTKDHGLGSSTDPHMCIFSADDVDADDTKRLCMYHDGSNAYIDNGTGRIITNSAFTVPPQTQSVADSGDGNPAAATLTPTSTQAQLTCNDGDTCDITMGEGSAVDGDFVIIVNVSSNVCDFADTAGVSELTGAFAMGQYDSLTLDYVVDRWVERSRSDN